MRTTNLVTLTVLAAFSIIAVTAEGRATQAPATPSSVPASRWRRMTSGANMPYWMSHLPFTTLPQMKEWTDVTEMKTMRQMGVRHIRLPFIPEAVCKSYSPLVIDEDKLAFLRQVLNDYRRNDLLVILDLHDGDRITAGMKNNPAQVSKLKSFWRTIAGRLNDLDPEYLMFEVLNEPNMDDKNQWWSVQRAVMAEIRSVAPQHTIVVESDRWSAIDEMLTRSPYSDPNVLYAFHFYEPFIFTHQGASWIGEEYSRWGGVKYPSDDANIEALRRQTSSPRRSEIFQDFTKERWGPAMIKKRIKLMADWAQKYNVKVICDEFGTVRSNMHPPSRGAWFRDTRRALEDNGLGWTAWEWRGGMGMVSEKITSKAGYASIDWLMLDALGFEHPPEPK